MSTKILIPIRAATVSEEFVRRVTMRSIQMQGVPEIHYAAAAPADVRAAWEAGALRVLTALESLGCRIMAPADLSPTLPHDREDPG